MKKEEFLSLRQIGSSGWDNFSDPQDIKDTSVSDALNVVFDKGYATPRKGRKLSWEKPTAETNSFLNIFTAKASDGTNYFIGCYAPNFYFRDEVNDQWVKINSSYSPSSTYKAYSYGYENWNAGISSDVLYACNGYENFIKWQISVGYISTQAIAGSTTITLTDATKFGTSGSIVIKQPNSSEFATTFSSKSGNTLTVPFLTQTIDAGACVVSQILEVAAMDKGKIIKKFQGRLIVANSNGGECTLSGSEVGNPENFSTGTDADDPFSQVITDGNGGIVGVDDFGEYLLISKSNSLHKLAIQISQDADGTSYKTITTVPVVSDISSGPAQPDARIKKNNKLYFATSTEGILAINPDITGSQTSVQTEILSMPIQPFVLNQNFSQTKTTSFNQKVLFSSTSDTTADTVLVFDLLRNVWTKFNNWNVKDWGVYNDKLYFGSRIDDAIYECFTSTKIDEKSPFEAYITTKSFDFGQGAMPKTTGLVFVSGYISPTEVLKFDVILTTGDSIVTIPYSIDGSGNLTVSAIPAPLAAIMMGVQILGSAQIIDPLTGLFRAYLAIPSRYGFFTMQLKIYSTVNGTDWGLTGLGFAPWIEQKPPKVLSIGAVGDPTNSQ